MFWKKKVQLKNPILKVDRHKLPWPKENDKLKTYNSTQNFKNLKIKHYKPNRRLRYYPGPSQKTRSDK